MKKLSLLISTDNFEKVMAGLIIANGAAASGTDTHVFFTFWGFNVIRKNNRKTYKDANFFQKFLGFLNKGGAENTKLSKFNFGGFGTKIIRGLMKEKGIPSPEEMILMAKESGVSFYSCDMSRNLFGIDKSDLIPNLIKDSIGVASFLEMSKDADQCLVF